MNKSNKDKFLVAISVIMLLFTALINWTIYSWLILISVTIILFVWYFRKLEIVQSEKVASVGGRKGGLGGIPPALQILGEISSNYFESTPPDTRAGFLTHSP